MTLTDYNPRQKALREIGTRAELFRAFLKGENLRGYYDINKLSEDFFSVILNHTYSLNLKNLNRTGQINFKSIDLGDSTNKITFQVTSENTKSKIKKTLQGYEDSKKYLDYPEIKVLLLDSKKPGNLDDLNRISGKFVFDHDADVITLKDLLSAMEDLDVSVLGAILKYWDEELPLIDMVTDQSVDFEIVQIVGEILESSDFDSSSTSFEYLDTPEKIELNFTKEEDKEFITREYTYALPRFKSITQIIAAYGTLGETVLQSAMFDLYNKHKQENSDNRQVYSEMIKSITDSITSTEQTGARKLAIKSLIMFHFEDCTIFERTSREKNGIPDAS